MQQRSDDTPTITTVARLANVSVASASRVLNGIKTNPDTLARVTGMSARNVIAELPGTEPDAESVSCLEDFRREVEA